MSAPAGAECQHADLAAEQREVLASALSDAVTHREPVGECADCSIHPAGLCEPHADDLDVRDSYLELARRLGIKVEQ